MCLLQCKNGGQCDHHSEESGKLAEHDIHVQLANLASKMGEHMTAERCSCPKGFIGLDCSIPLKVCGHSSHACAHGSMCDWKGTENKKDLFECECGRSKTHGGLAVAGKYCEHLATTFCVEGDLTGLNSFCTNEGKCISKISKGQE